MVKLNTQCHNFPAAPGAFGGSMCTCDKCVEKRSASGNVKTIQRQMSFAANELDKLNAMMDKWPDKQIQLRGASDMLADWEIGILSDVAT